MKDITYGIWGRYKDTCQLCDTFLVRNGPKREGEVHHIDGRPWNNNPCNLILLCQKCHRGLHVAIRREDKSDILVVKLIEWLLSEYGEEYGIKIMAEVWIQHFQRYHDFTRDYIESHIIGDLYEHDKRKEDVQ